MLGWASLVLAALATASGGTGLEGIHYNAPPPNFALAPASAPAHYLTDLRGRVVVIDFWATWCDVCTKEMKYFVRAQQEFGDRVAVVTISNELHDVAASYFRTWNIGLPVVEDLDGAISRSYGVSKIPITLVLNPAGEVSYVSVGGLDWPELQGAVERAMGSDVGTLAPRVLR